LAAPEPIPDNPVLGVDMYLTPRRFKFGSLAKSIQIDKDEHSDLTNTQLPEKMDTRNPKRVFLIAETEGAMTGKEGYELALESLEMSPILLK
jgi:hypothetical protein